MEPKRISLQRNTNSTKQGQQQPKISAIVIIKQIVVWALLPGLSTHLQHNCNRGQLSFKNLYLHWIFFFWQTHACSYNSRSKSNGFLSLAISLAISSCHKSKKINNTVYTCLILALLCKRCCKTDLCPQVEHLDTVCNISFRFRTEKNSIQQN